MPSLRDRFHDVDRVDVPDIWAGAVRRQPSAPPFVSEPREKRLVTIVVALAVAVLAIGIAVRAFPSGPLTATGSRTSFTVPADPCSLLTVGEVEQASGGRVLSTRRLDRSDLITSTPDTLLPCEYVTNSRFGSILIATDPSGTSGFVTERDRDPRNVIAISGLGDEAFTQGKGSVWVRVGDAYFSIGSQLGAGDDAVAMLTGLAREALAPATSVVTPANATIAKLDTQTFPLSVRASDVVDSGGYVWAAASVSDVLAKVDPSTGHTDAIVPLDGEPGWLAPGKDIVWVTTSGVNGEEVVGINTDSNAVVSKFSELSGPILQTNEGLWAFKPAEGSMVLIDPQTGAELRSVDVSSQPFDIAASGDTLWLLDSHAGTIDELPSGADTARTVTDRSSGVWLASDATSVYFSSWRESTSDATSTVAVLDGRAEPFGSVYNFRPMVVVLDHIWFVGGPGDGPRVSGLCAMRTDDGAVDACGDVSVNLEGSRDPVAFDPSTGTFWAVAYDRAVIYRVQPQP